MNVTRVSKLFKQPLALSKIPKVRTRTDADTDVARLISLVLHTLALEREIISQNLFNSGCKTSLRGKFFNTFLVVAKVISLTANDNDN